VFEPHYLTDFMKKTLANRLKYDKLAIVENGGTRWTAKEAACLK
jgi:hypothetical protein